MAAYAALISLELRINRHGDDPNYLPVPANVKVMILDAMEQIRSTWEALEILDFDNYRKSCSRMKTWQLAESQLLNQFPFEFAIALSLCRKVSATYRLRWLIFNKKVDVSDIGRIRDEAGRLQHVLESLLSLLQLKPQQQRRPQILTELDTEMQQVHSFMQTAEKIIEDGNKSKNMVRLGDAFPQIAEDLIPGIGEHGYKMLINMEGAIRRMNHGSRKRVSAVEVQIREAVCEIEDLLDTQLINQFPVPFPMDFDEVQQYIPQFTQRLGNLKQEYINELISMLPDQESGDNDDTISSSRMSCPKMVGLHDEFIKIKDALFHSSKFLHLESIVIHGMGGIGKTVLAKQVFDDPSIMEIFELRVWVKVGQNFQLKVIKESILTQVMSRPYNIEGGDERLDEYLHESFKGKRCLVVFDDVWDDRHYVFDDMIRSLFPGDDDIKNGGRIRFILTTRCPYSHVVGRTYEMRFMSEEESWQLLCEKVFGNESSLCPPSLESAGKKIAESCEGLPLTIVTIGSLLSKVERTPEKWNELADSSVLFDDAYDQMSKVLLPSYHFLTQKLKAYFLYMGVFPRTYDISVSEVFKLWATEKLVRKIICRNNVKHIIQQLFENSLIIVRQKDVHFEYKTWKLNSSIWHLCRREALKNKFSYVLERFGDSLSGDMKNQRRLCVHKNILFGIKDVHESMSSILTARSLLCTGPPHQYPVPICFDLKLLRILNALTVRLYEFPMDVLKLFQLKYLALTCYGNLPSPISKLWALEILIIRRHRSIGSTSRDVQSYLPVEIWDMKELTHLQVMGSDLPEPCEEEGTLLPNLEKLLDVSAHSCNKRVLEGTPNLTKLGIRIELNPNGYDTETLRCFDHIHRLKKLKSLKCVVVNPTFGPHIVPPTLQIFPPSLEKLSLSGFGYPWEHMRFISSLPNLICLKLRCYAFCGTNLEIKVFGFPKLRYLRIKDTDLVNLTVEKGSLEKAFSIILRRCYKLESITCDKMEKIKLYDCYEFRNPNNYYPWNKCYINNSGLEGKD